MFMRCVFHGCVNGGCVLSVHLRKLTAGTTKWRFGSDDFPSQRVEFSGSMLVFW